jgi:hypothetical protein
MKKYIYQVDGSLMINEMILPLESLIADVASEGPVK